MLFKILFKGCHRFNTQLGTVSFDQCKYCHRFDAHFETVLLFRCKRSSKRIMELLNL